MRHNIEFDAEGALLRGWFYEPQPAASPAPCVVMAHGWSSTKRMHLDRFAEVFAAAGLAVLVYDNRGWGESEAAPGKPRHEIDPWEQIRDYQHAITYAQNHPDVDPDRIGAPVSPPDTPSSSRRSTGGSKPSADRRRSSAAAPRTPTSPGCTTGWSDPNFSPPTGVRARRGSHRPPCPSWEPTRDSWWACPRPTPTLFSPTHAKNSIRPGRTK
ncbi:alpha/beta hydrolase [Streptomyces misionensis]|uniref:alpha/beta hydrolase n=1 Tax=Streptomyces misionensis TaxID=67331 RepID=UPI0036F63AF4